MNSLDILWYDILDDYVFYCMKSRKFYIYEYGGKKRELWYSPRFEFILTIVDDELEMF